jgi:acyl phosphate:glycerol-3-phosphate acyltransferase
MYYLMLFLSVMIGYLSGSVSYARIFTRIATGKDISKMGNGNPGTSNVMRQVGKGWGTLTFLSDILKGSLAMLLVKALFFSSAAFYPVNLPFDGAAFAAVALTGIAAIYGHAFPVYYGFKGGGSIAVLFGCLTFLVYPQFFICAAFAWIFVKIFLAKIKYPLARTTPIVFIILTPLFVLAESLITKAWHPLHSGSPMFDHIGFGNHFLMIEGNAWLPVLTVFVFSLSVIPTNLALLKNEILVKENKQN